MFGTVNKVFLVGNMGQDPVMKTFKRDDGTDNTICSFSVATTHGKKIDGKWENETEWHYVNVQNSKQADTLGKHAVKGSKVCVEGSLRYREYTDKDGETKKITEILVSSYHGQVTILSKLEKENNHNNNQSSVGMMEQVKNTPQHNLSAIVDDEIPF